MQTLRPPRSLSLLAVLLAPLPLLAGSGGPDAGDLVYTDSDETDGPPHALLELVDPVDLALGDDALATVALPFAFDWYGEEWEEATVSSNGVLFFDGATDAATPSCPGDGDSWSGVAAFWDDLAAGTVQTSTIGRYPDRVFVVDWEAAHASLPTGSVAHLQIWLLEGRQEAVIALDELTFGDAAIDGGASAAIGVQGSSGDGLPWSCSAALADGSTAWFGPQGGRPAAAWRSSSDLETPWTGAATRQYLGRAIVAGDLSGDGADDLLIGNQDEDVVYLFNGAPRAVGASVALADATLTGDSGSDFGAALALPDLDGDGVVDLAIGAPLSDLSATDDGVVAVFGGLEVGGELDGIDDAGLLLLAATSGLSTPEKKRTGASLATGDLNGDGYGDLVVGAPRDDQAGTNAGAVYLWLGSATATTSGTQSLDDAAAVLLGEASSDEAGTSLAVGDTDGDGLADLVVGAPNHDDTGSNEGRAYLVLGSLLSGSMSLGSGASATFTGPASDDGLGVAVALGDTDGDGLADLLVGAAGSDDGGSNAGQAWLVLGPASFAGDNIIDTVADFAVVGDLSTAGAGSALAIGDADLDGLGDLIVAAPNYNGYASGGGAVGLFTDLSSSPLDLSAGTHMLAGADSGGGAGTALALATDFQGDGYADLLVSSPYTEFEGITGAGAVYGWSLVPDFVDEDGDGFVSNAAGGPDCDDSDGAVYPGGVELTSNGVDDDCDGWIDDLVIVRLVGDWWDWDLEAELGVTDADLFDFEDAAEGDDLSSLYTTSGVTLAATSSVVGASEIWGALPRGAIGAKVSGSSSDNSLQIAFSDSVDAVALRLLDGDEDLEISASVGGAVVLTKIPFSAFGANRSGGQEVGFTFAQSVDTITLSGATSDAFGIDDLEVVWADGTDRDGDGYADDEGDCDDTNAAISPAATEDLSNGVDDDCDGVVDGGSLTSFTDYPSWSSAASLDSELIDFEDLSAAEVVEEQYSSVGATFDGNVTVAASVDGAAARDSLLAESSSPSISIVFDEIQPAVGLYLVDGAGSFTLRGSVGGVTLYTWKGTFAAENVAGGTFAGMVFDYGIDTLVIANASTTDAWGIDDVEFHVLGLDDADGDGYTEAEGDCDDFDATASPEGTETWYDGVDSDCDGASDYDVDGDGYDSDAYGGTDCEDSDASVSPDATETWYDGVDSDCDGLSDYDVDLDGFDAELYGGTDCDDDSAEINPDADEVYYDGVDDNCDPSDDDDADGDGFSVEGTSSGSSGGGDCDDDSATTNPDATDTWYDGVDSDCDGADDYDVDGDGYESADYGGEDCDDSDASVYPEAPGDTCYDGVDTDCDGTSEYDCDEDGYDTTDYGGTDCDDAEPATYPGATDTWGDGIDSDCGGELEFDDDGDGYEDEARGGDDCDDGDATVYPGATETWYDGTDTDCDGGSDYDADQDSHDSDAWGGDDCDDSAPTVYPGATDYYYDGIDQDCDASDDYDGDGDGYDDINWGGNDCDDADDSIHPYASEVAGDGIDQNCDGLDAADADEDGSLSDEDCDDGDPSIYPGAIEICYDGIDSDCDEGDDFDCDEDGFQAEDQGGTDCDDANDEVYPGAPDSWYDGIDADCGGQDDYDADEDGDPAPGGGGGDCDDADPTRSSLMTEDPCGGGDEDCDGVADEDCWTEPVDTATDTGVPVDTAEPEPEDTATPYVDPNAGWTAPVDTGTQSGVPTCGCSAGGSGRLAGLWMVGLVLLGVRRRRR